MCGPRREGVPSRSQERLSEIPDRKGEAAKITPHGLLASDCNSCGWERSARFHAARRPGPEHHKGRQERRKSNAKNASPRLFKSYRLGEGSHGAAKATRREDRDALKEVEGRSFRVAPCFLPWERTSTWRQASLLSHVCQAFFYASAMSCRFITCSAACSAACSKGFIAAVRFRARCRKVWACFWRA